MNKLFENEYFIVWEDIKGDIPYVIENKKSRKITIQYGNYGEEIRIRNNVGISINEEYIVNAILNGNYSVE